MSVTVIIIAGMAVTVINMIGRAGRWGHAAFTGQQGYPYRWHMPLAKTVGPRKSAAISREPDLGFCQLLCSATKISRLETGVRRPSLRDVRDLCALYEG